MSDSSSRRGSTTSAPPHRGSEVLRRASEISRHSAASTTIESDGTSTPEPRRKSSVFANPGEWRASERDAASISSSARRDSANSQGTISRRQSAEGVSAEISFSNGEYTNVVARRTSPSPTGLRKPSITSSNGSSPSNPLDAQYLEVDVVRLDPSDDTQKRKISNASAPPERDGSAVSSLDDALPKPPLALDRITLPNLELPPLPPSPSDKSRRFPAIIASATRPKVASRLRSMIKRSSSDRISDKGDESATEQEVEDAPEINKHYNEFENNEQPLSPGRARIYTVDQARRGSFLPIDRIKSEGSSMGGPRRGSVRLSEADVGMLLGKVSRISADTLRQAAQEGNTTLCEALVRGSVLIDDADIDGKTALMFASEAGKGDTTEHLLYLGAAVDSKEENGLTALCFAVNASKLSCVKVLVAWGADCNIAVNGDTIFTMALLKIEGSLGLSSEDERIASYAQTSEVCRVMVRESKSLPNVRRERLRKPTLFLLDEWVRAREAGEVLVVPPMEKLVEGEKTLINFLKQHRQRVNIIATIKIWFVVSFIGFDLATREMKMTPARVMTYAFLYVGAYYL